MGNQYSTSSPRDSVADGAPGGNAADRTSSRVASLIRSAVSPFSPGGGGKQKRRVILLGLNGAGKTTMLWQIQKAAKTPTSLGPPSTSPTSKGMPVINPHPPPFVPTEGFNAETLRYNRYEITVWDLGGSDRLRPLWRHYYGGVQGVVFVIDAMDRERLPIAASELLEAIKDPQLAAAQFIVFLNKQDLAKPNDSTKPLPVGIEEAEELLGLKKPDGEALLALGERSLKVVICSAYHDIGVREGVLWLTEGMKPL